MGDVVAFRRRPAAGEAPTRQSSPPRRSDRDPTVPTRPTGPTRPMRPGRPEPPHRRGDPLWRELVGEVLRRRRIERSETQREVADRAGISVQYLSELERGRKEPSSEMLAAVGGALELPLLDLTREVGRRLLTTSGRPTGPVALAA